MNADEAISEVDTNIRPNPDKFSPLYREVVITLADEVERLRAELAVEREAVKSLGNSFDKLRAELAAAKEASVVTEMKWQPMETAPKDGTVIVLATTVRVAESSWGICRPQWDGYVANEGKPCWRASGEEKVRGGDPLCWMPMPQLTPNDRMRERREQ